jgi:hypothetical protein
MGLQPSVTKDPMARRPTREESRPAQRGDGPRAGEPWRVWHFAERTHTFLNHKQIYPPFSVSWTFTLRTFFYSIYRSPIQPQQSSHREEGSAGRSRLEGHVGPRWSQLRPMAGGGPAAQAAMARGSGGGEQPPCTCVHIQIHLLCYPNSI